MVKRNLFILFFVGVCGFVFACVRGRKKQRENKSSSTERNNNKNIFFLVWWLIFVETKREEVNFPKNKCFPIEKIPKHVFVLKQMQHEYLVFCC